MRIAVTGAGGMVGRALARRLSGGDFVIALGHPDLDVTDENAVRAWMSRERPEGLINCAVLGVDECEADPERAHAVNVAAPMWLARAAGQIGAQMLHLSSNYVFDGCREGGEPYTIENPPNPINVYGRTKWEGERAVAAACPGSSIVRTSWVFGPGKASFLSDVHRRLLAGDRVRAISDTRASATYVEDLAPRIAEILRMRQSGTHHVVNAGACTYFEFALEAGRALDLPAERVASLIEPAPEEQMRRAAPRPRSTPLAGRRGDPPMRAWQEALADYIKSDIAIRRGAGP